MGSLAILQSLRESKIISLLLGLLIYMQWPSSSFWALGILVGVSMIVSGIARVMLSVLVRKAGTALA